MEEPISNLASERVVLSGIMKHGSEAFIDVDDIIETKDFTLEQNQIVYACIKKTLENSSTIDLPSLLSAAEDLGMTESFKDRVPPDHIQGLMNCDVQLENVRTHAIKLKKLDIAREVRLRARRVISDINNVTGDETIDKIISVGETPFFELSSSLNNSVEDRPVSLGDDIEGYIAHIEDNPCEMLGISSGFQRFDTAIGGGFRRKCVDLIAARPKVGKSMLADNVAAHISGELNIPVLVLDTEMAKEDHYNRLIARFSGININDISTGNYVKMVNGKERIDQAVEKIKGMPFDYITIAGKPFEETLSIIRRWLVKRVGTDENGRTNDCMVIYDYLKLMASNEINDSMKEFQVLGFQITKLHNFTVQYDFPCLSFVQLNRDGITKESTDAVSGSDRLIWLCSSFTIFKNKSDEEMAEDGGETGNRKLIPIVSRHGGGLDDYDYINVDMKGEIGTVEERMTKSESIEGSRVQKEGFVIEGEQEEIEEPF
jgi:replicative DNA helicase